MEYEINFLVLQSHTEKVDSIREQVKSLIKDHEGSVVDELIYKKRKLAYEIKHEAYGFFTVLRFKLKDNSAIIELKKELNLLQDVARYIIVRTDELPQLNKEILSLEKREKTTIKQAEVEKIVAKSEEKATEKVEERPEKPEQKKVKAQQTEEEPVAKEEEKEKKPAKEEEEKPAKEEDKKEEDKKDKDQKVSADDKSSLEDLDKKLDEILSI